MTTILDSTSEQQPRSDFYTYMLRRPAGPDTPPEIIFPDGTVPFYIGKGHGRRIKGHEMCAQKREDCRHISCRVIRKVWREDGEIVSDKMEEHLTEVEAFKQEKSWIAYGRKIGWPLRNLTDGGEGTSGYKTAPAQIERHRQQMKELFSASERVENQRQIMLQYWEEHPEIREQYRIKCADPVARAKLGEPNIGNAYNAKSYEGFMNPLGEVFIGIFNLAQFAREHNLDRVHLGEVDQGTRISHKGWTRYPPLEREEKPPTYAKSGFKSPDGTIYEAEVVPNLTSFCAQHGLERRCMGQLGKGELHSYKGWTRHPEIKPERDYHNTYTGPSLISPEGVIYTPEMIDNLTQFSLTHSLQTSNMSLVAQGKQVAHKGWTRYPPLEKPSKYIPVKSPNGTIYTIDNMSEFCRQHGLHSSAMSAVNLGKLPSYKGWTRCDPDVTQPPLFE